MFIKLCRIGRDTECRYTPQGTPVATISLVYDIGFGENKKSQWIEATLWGKKAEGLTPHLTKGKQVLLTADDLEVETYTRKSDNTVGAKLKAKAIDIEFAGGSREEVAPSQQQKPQGQTPPTQQETKSQSSGPPLDFDDDVPF